MSDTTQKKAKPLRVVVTSDKMQKSRTGVVNRLVKHDEYDKYIRRRTRVMFHDEENQTRIGDEVLVSQTRPLSKNKKFTLLQIVRKAAE